MQKNQSPTELLEKRFKKLFQDGVLVDIHVGKWGMSHQLTPKDLGLDTAENKDKVTEFMKLGKKMLFQDEVRLLFPRIESAARNYLNENSHKFEVMANTHFVPRKKLLEVRLKLETFRTAYNKAADQFVTDYDKHKSEMQKSYPNHWTLLEPYYPPAAEVRPKFYFAVSSFEIAFPKSFKTLSVSDIYAENLAMEEARKKYEGQMDEQYKAALSQMENFVKESALALRGKVIELFETLANKVRNKEVISETNLKTIRSLVSNFDGLDFFDDAAVKSQLKEVKKLVSSGADFKDDAKALERLNTAITSTLETAKNMSDIDTLTGGYIRKLELGDL